MSRRLAYATLACLLVGWVLPPDRVVREMARIREKQPAIRAEAVLIGHDPSWPEEVLLELHPEYGTRVLGDQGERWLFLGGDVVGRNPGREGRADTAPRWLPDLEPLVMRDPNGLFAWLEETHVDPEVTELARCEDADCFVLGGRTAAAQVWVDKDRFELRRVQRSLGRAVEFGDYTDWGRFRFPGTIQVEGPEGPVARFEIVRTEAAPDLGPEDFTLDWVFDPPNLDRER